MPDAPRKTPDAPRKTPAAPRKTTEARGAGNFPADVSAAREIAVVFRARCGNLGAAVFADAIRLVLRGERIPDAVISCAVVRDEEIHALNRRFLRHDYPTDIITFPLEEDPLEAELVISADTARRQAREYRVTMRDECARLAIHGTLHLCGYDDLRESDRLVMKQREELYLEKFRNSDRTRR